MYRPSNIQCDWADRVDCGDRPICDKNDENCHDGPQTTPDPEEPSTTSTTTKEPITTSDDDDDLKCEDLEHNFFADPDNCIKYFECWNGVATKKTCNSSK